MRYSSGKIAEICSALIYGDKNIDVNHILTDSRSIVYPGKTVFFAIKGVQYDAHIFIPDLIKAGVRVFVISEMPKEKYDATFILTDNVISALQDFAEYHRKQFNIPVIGITGSNGKTIVKEWLSRVLSKKYRLTRSPKSYNSQIGVPLSVALIDKHTEKAVFEAGISKPDEMHKLEQIISPQYGVLTSFGDAHQENFDSKEQKLREKLNLFKNSTTLIIPAEDENVRKICEDFGKKYETDILSWSFSNKNSLYLIKTSKGVGETLIKLKNQNNHDEFSFKIPFIDKASVENSVSVFLILMLMGESPDFIAAEMKKLQPVAMRLELKEGINNCTIINDSYNSDINSLQIAIDFAVQQNKKDIVLILSDIYQSGFESFLLYKHIADLISQRKQIKQLIGIGRDISSFSSYFRDQDIFFNKTEDFINSGLMSQFKDVTILLKGARSFEFEKISGIFELKAHRTVLEINLSAVSNNLKYFKSFLDRNTKLMVMVKAFSYGSGYIEIGRHLQNQSVDYLGVAIADEGVELRKAGIHLPLMVMNPQPGNLHLLNDYHLEPEVYSVKMLKHIAEFIDTSGTDEFNIHLKLDTGMHRLGITPDQLDEVLHILINNPGIKIKSVFSHLAGSDVNKLDDFTQKQIAIFKKMYRSIANELSYKPLRHIANTNAIIRFPESRLDMVRLGIGLYGIAEGNNPELQNVTVLKSSVISIKKLKKGETVSYNRSGVLNKDSEIAVIPLGYADGLNRKLSNKNWEVEIDGKLYPVIGDICMDMTMLDVTDGNVSEGDQVLVFGGKKSVNDMAKKLETIPYEVLTGVSQRVKRIYYQE